MPRLMVLIASTRPGRVGLPVGRWVHRQAVADGRFEIDLADLATINLPFLDEPHHPRLGRYTQPHTRDWSERVTGADAFIFVMPEYNYGYSAPLKNAIDYLYHEWRYKPVGFVSYGGIAAGTRAVQLLKPVLTALRLTPATEAVMIPFVGRLIGPDGEFADDERLRAGLTGVLDELLRLDRALAPLRQGTGG